jgi:hypothetical protein
MLVIAFHEKRGVDLLLIVAVKFICGKRSEDCPLKSPVS